jgi:hypothetical protein
MVTTTCGFTVRQMGSRRTRLPPTARKLASGPCSRATGSAGVALAPAGLHQRFQRGLQLFPAHRIQLPGQAAGAVQVPGQGQPPALGGVGFGAVGVQRLPVVAHHRDQLVVALPDRDRSERGVDHRQVDVRGGRLGQPRGGGHLGDQPGLPGGELPVGERGGGGGQVLQGAPGRHDLACLAV